MKRIHADLLLGIVGLIWGFAFVAQKDSAGHVGSLLFVAARFFLSALFVLPFAWREKGLHRGSPVFAKKDRNKILSLCALFSFAVIIQQVGIPDTSVTNASFLTGSYVVMVPFAAFALYRRRITPVVVVGGMVAFIGIWLLTGADVGALIQNFNRGDSLILLCALGFALQIPILGNLVGSSRLPCTLSLVQYLVVTAVAFILACCFETIDWYNLVDAWIPIVYAGIASGGIAYTLQAVAQQHTPSAEAAIICGCGEAFFGALGGVWLLHERITPAGYAGCGLILASIVLVETVPLIRRRTA